MITNMAQTSAHQQTSSHPLIISQSLSSRWQHYKIHARMPYRIGMRLVEILALAAGMFIVPTGIHCVVQSLDEVYELLGRRSHSPYVPPTSIAGVAIAAVLLLGWHLWLGQLSYSAIMEGQDEGNVKEGEAKPRKTSWSRILGRIVMPLLLLSFGIHFAYQLGQRLITPTPFVTPNLNDMKEIERELEGRI